MGGSTDFLAKQQKPAVSEIKVAAAVGPSPCPKVASVSRSTSPSPARGIAEAEKLVEKAHQVCPYSNVARGNIEVTRKAVAA